MTIPLTANLYAVANGTSSDAVAIPFYSPRNPTSSDINFPIGKHWINFSLNSEFVLTSLVSANGLTTAFWVLETGGAQSQFIVGPNGSFSTIQSALNAANAAGGGAVYITAGTYTENLTLYSGVSLNGNNYYDTAIVGVHTPPSSGTLYIKNLSLRSATDILNSSAAGTTQITMDRCWITVTNGYTFDLPNWTSAGSINCFGLITSSVNDGFILCGAGVVVNIYVSRIGGGTAHSMTLGGGTFIDAGTVVLCPALFITGAILISNDTTYVHTVTCANNSIATFFHDTFTTGGTPAVVTTSSGAIALYNCLVNSSATYAIDGTGVINLSGVTYAAVSAVDATATTTNTGATTSGEIRASTDLGGALNYFSITNTNTGVISTGVGSVKMSTANAATNSQWIKVYIGTTPYWIPAWTSNAP